MEKSSSEPGGPRAESEELARFRGPHVAVDIALFTVTSTERTSDLRLAFLLHRRGPGVAEGAWALPGRMVRERERLSEAVEIALQEKCNLSGIQPKQLQVFDEPTRDFRGWVMSVGFVTTQKSNVVHDALASNSNLALGYLSHRGRLKLELPEKQEQLPFEQDLIVQKGIADLRGRYAIQPDPDRLLGGTFTLYQLRKIHEAILGEEMDKDLFRRRMESTLVATGEFSTGSIGKPAQLFKRVTR